MAQKAKRTGANNGPARQRYWSSKTLEKHKVKALMRATGMSRAEATAFWQRARGNRRMRLPSSVKAAGVTLTVPTEIL